MGDVEADFALLRRRGRDFNDEPDDDEPDVDKDELDDVELDDEGHSNELEPESVSFFRSCCLARRDLTTVHPSSIVVDTMLSSCGSSGSAGLSASSYIIWSGRITLRVDFK